MQCVVVDTAYSRLSCVYKQLYAAPQCFATLNPHLNRNPQPLRSAILPQQACLQPRCQNKNITLPSRSRGVELRDVVLALLTQSNTWR